MTLPKRNEKNKTAHRAVSRQLAEDPVVNQIIEMILERAMEYTNADGGSIFLVESIPQDSLGGQRNAFKDRLKFHKSQTHSVTNQISDFYMELDSKSIAGHAAFSGECVRVEDCRNLPLDCAFSFNGEFDESAGYQTKSVLAVPIKSKDSVIGVVQLVNKVRTFRRASDFSKRLSRKDVIAFSENDERLIEAFASHAGIALENASLTQDIARLFESFVRASVTAIEARDPSTSGHSDRVAELCVSFAQKVDGISTGLFKDIKFTDKQIRELRYAALLHDFGKIGVRENILVKAKKLFPHELETILLRLDTLKAQSEAKHWREAAEDLMRWIESGGNRETLPHLGQVLWKIDGFGRQVDEIRRGISIANEPQILDKDFDIDKLMKWINEVSFKVGKSIVTPEEAIRLSIPRGTLGKQERREIESHVSYTYQFLTQIAWTEDLSQVPQIAHAHHEKLDGSGYPLGLQSNHIPIQARIMTISDIFDALTAMDRPYKKAVSQERAIEILHLEASQGKLDTDLLKIFVEAEIYKACEKSFWPKKRTA